MSYLAINSLFPECKLQTQFLDYEGLSLDGLTQTYPSEVEINHARKVDEVSDATIFFNNLISITHLPIFEVFKEDVSDEVPNEGISKP